MLHYHFYIQFVEFALLVLLGVFLLIQLYYYVRFYIVSFTGYTPFTAENEVPLSVIICAKNEGKNLEENLPAILEQDYPNYEVIVVNDCSQDDTDWVIADYMKKYKHLRTTSIQPDRKFTHGKKLAVTVGVKSAKNEHLIFTDADCKPVSNTWLKSMQAGFKGKEIILAYGAYQSKKGLLNSFLRYDTAFIGLNYLGFALGGRPYMGVGRNLGYTKELFFKNKGFASHYGLLSGDDDLFINETATKDNVAVILGDNAITQSVPCTTWAAWFKQKVRHLSTSKYYKTKDIFRLGMEPISRLGFYSLFAITLFSKVPFYIPLAVFAVRFLMQLITSGIIKKKFGEKRLFLLLPIFDLVSLFINLIIYLISLFRGRQVQWK